MGALETYFLILFKLSVEILSSWLLWSDIFSSILMGRRDSIRRLQSHRIPSLRWVRVNGNPGAATPSLCGHGSCTHLEPVDPWIGLDILCRGWCLLPIVTRKVLPLVNSGASDVSIKPSSTFALSPLVQELLDTPLEGIPPSYPDNHTGRLRICAHPVLQRASGRFSIHRLQVQ